MPLLTRGQSTHIISWTNFLQIYQSLLMPIEMTHSKPWKMFPGEKSDNFYFCTDLLYSQYTPKGQKRQNKTLILISAFIWNISINIRVESAFPKWSSQLKFITALWTVNWYMGRKVHPLTQTYLDKTVVCVKVSSNTSH